MWVFLLKQPAWFNLIVLIIGVFALIGFMMLVKTIIEKGIILKKDSISIGPEKAKTHGATCQKCPNVGNVVLALMESARIVEKKIQIADTESIKEPMRYADQIAIQIKSWMHNVFVEVCKRKKQEGANLITYRLIIFFVERELFSKLRTILHENNFAEKTEMQFQEYANKQADVFWLESTQLLSDFCSCLDGISWEDISKANRGLRSQVKNSIYDVFMNIYRIALKKKQDKEDLGKQMEHLIKNYVA